MSDEAKSINTHHASLNFDSSRYNTSTEQTKMARLVLGAGLACAVLYIGWLRRELADARSRGDMYRDIAAALDLQRGGSHPLPSDSVIDEG
jgi:hypothetical protein